MADNEKVQSIKNHLAMPDHPVSEITRAYNDRLGATLSKDLNAFLVTFRQVHSENSSRHSA